MGSSTMENNIIVSFIIPAFNSSKYIERCILSVYSNVKCKFEILIINDGSTDDTLLIISKIKKIHKDITVITLNNNGVSNARNIGINSSKGQFLCFLDSDDFYIDSSINDLIELAIIKNVDIIRGKYQTFDGYNFTNNPCKIPVSCLGTILSGSLYLKECIKNNCIEVVPWLGLFKKSFLVQNDLKFPVGICYEEDHLFFLKCLFCKNDNRILQTDFLFYAYNSVGGVTKSPVLKQALDVINVVNLEIDFTNKLNIDKHIKKNVMKYITSSFYQLTSIFGRVSRNDQKTIFNSLPKEYRKIMLRNSLNFHMFAKFFIFFYFNFFLVFYYRFKL